MKYSKEEILKREDLQLRIDNLDKELILKTEYSKDYGHYDIYLPLYDKYFRFQHSRLSSKIQVNDYIDYDFVENMYCMWVSTYDYNTDIPHNEGVNIKISIFDYMKDWCFKEDWKKIILNENRIKKLERILE